MWLVGCVPPPRPSRLSLLLCVSVSVPCSLIHLHCFSFCLILLAWGAPQGGVGAGTSSASFAVLFPTQGRARAVSSAGQMTTLSLS